MEKMGDMENVERADFGGDFIYPETGTAPDDLQQRMHKAFAFGKPEDVAAVKAAYMEAYPDQLEGIEALFSIQPLLNLNKEIALIRAKSQERRLTPEIAAKLTEITEINYLLTHFIWKNGGDDKFLELFWQAAEKITRNPEEYAAIKGMRKGIMTQVATMHLFREAGQEPQLSKPSDDALKSIDLWSDTSHVVQVKTGSEDELEIIETENIPAVTVQFGPKGRTDLYASKSYSEARDFRTKVEYYRKEQKRPDLKGYLVVIPYSEIDPTTGEPSQKLKDAIRAKLGGRMKKAA